MCDLFKRQAPDLREPTHTHRILFLECNGLLWAVQNDI